MPASRTKFYLDKDNKKWAGVCAGIADYTGLDVTLIRVALVLLTVTTSGSFILAYFIAAWLAPAKPRGLYPDQADARFWQGVRANPKRSTGEVRAKLRDIDRRMADIETLYTSRNTQLAEEIESLR